MKAKKGVVLSDDEEDESEPVVRPPKGRVPAKSAARSRSPQTDKSLRAMMDIDDSMSHGINLIEILLSPCHRRSHQGVSYIS